MKKEYSKAIMPTKFLLKLYGGLKNTVKKIEKQFEDKNFAAWFATPDHDNLRVEYDLGPDSLVLDAGGFRGDWASDIFARYLCAVLVFEPVRSFADGIAKRFRQNPKIRLFRFGMGGSSRKETLHLRENASSIFGGGPGSGSSEEIEIKDIAAFIRENGIKKIDLLKLNIEGMEYEVLERLLETGLARIITDIQVQFHNVAPDSEARMRAIQKGLGQSHRPTYQYKFVWENWRLK